MRRLEQTGWRCTECGLLEAESNQPCPEHGGVEPVYRLVEEAPGLSLQPPESSRASLGSQIRDFLEYVALAGGPATREGAARIIDRLRLFESVEPDPPSLLPGRIPAIRSLAELGITGRYYTIRLCKTLAESFARQTQLEATVKVLVRAAERAMYADLLADPHSWARTRTDLRTFTQQARTLVDLPSESEVIHVPPV